MTHFTEENRPEPPMAASPIEMLSAFLDYHRATLLWKASGLTREDLVKSRTTSGTTLLGIVKHSACVERWWFLYVFAGLDLNYGWSKEDPNADWRIEPDETPEQIFALYEAACADSRAAIAGAAWDDLAKRSVWTQGTHTLGWVLTHMLEEVARHVGQVDILREEIDGLTGE